jgi:type I restriction enzyme M protein
MRLTKQQLETHLMGAANILRGKTAGQDYKNYILGLMFYKRLCDQWEREVDDTIAKLEKDGGRSFTDQQKAVIRARDNHRYNIPEGARWGDVLAESERIGEKLTTAMRAVSAANESLRGVFTVDWAQPAPDGSGTTLIPNEVVHSLVQHFNEIGLSNVSVPPDVLGHAYEYLLKYFADDAGAKAGEFFTPPEVVDTLVRIVEPKAGESIYDPTVGSGGMLIHSGQYIQERGQPSHSATYFGQEMNWSNFAIGKINSVLHDLEADIRGGKSTISDPAFLTGCEPTKFNVVLANFPFSDEFWWLRPGQKTDDKTKKKKLQDEIFGKGGKKAADGAASGYRDTYRRFGVGTVYPAPPAGYGDYAFILHILASLKEGGRAGIVCPQGVLFRGQPEMEEETDELDKYGNPKVKRRKADDEHLIRKKLLETKLIDAVISLPLNVFFGAGVPACLLILRRERPVERRDSVLLVYAARHFRELSAQNQLRPQDVMRILVHVQAYGDATKVSALVAAHSARIEGKINDEEANTLQLITVEFENEATQFKKLGVEIEAGRIRAETAEAKGETAREKTARSKQFDKLDKAVTKLKKKLDTRDERLVEARRRAEEERQAVRDTGSELRGLYADPDELLKHARVVGLREIAENEFNLNIPRYVDTFEPEPRVEVAEALRELHCANVASQDTERELMDLLTGIGYVGLLADT